MIFLVFGSKSRYPLLFSGYPTIMHLLVFESSLDRFSFGTCAYAVHPKVRRYETDGLVPVQASSGVISFLSALVGLLFLRYAAVTTASPQSSSPKPLPLIMHLADSMIVLLA